MTTDANTGAALLDEDLQVYVNGTFRPAREAAVSVYSWGFTYGDGVFEGLCVRDGRCFGFERHMDRFFASAAYMRMAVPVSREECIAAIAQTARLNDLRTGYMRPIITRGTGRMGLRNIDSVGLPELFIIPQRERALTIEEIVARQMRAITVSVRRPPPACIDSRAKLCNYQNNILGVLQYRNARVDAGILLDVNGFIAEGPSENVFVIKDGDLLTPRGHNVLNGITRWAIMEIAVEQGRGTREADLTTHDLYTADEVFLTGSLQGVSPLCEIDGRPIGDGSMGAVSLELLHAYRERERGGYPLFG
ncbi:MAG: aminotransferase class IV [Solirubrobacteraceae bacterium]